MIHITFLQVILINVVKNLTKDDHRLQVDHPIVFSECKDSLQGRKLDTAPLVGWKNCPDRIKVSHITTSLPLKCGVEFQKDNLS